MSDIPSFRYELLWGERAPRWVANVIELDIFGSWVGGEVASEPLFDPAASGYAAPREPPADPALPYDEAYDEDGQPRPHYAALLEALGDPADARRRGEAPPQRPGRELRRRLRRRLRARPGAAHPHRA